MTIKYKFVYDLAGRKYRITFSADSGVKTHARNNFQVRWKSIKCIAPSVGEMHAVPQLSTKGFLQPGSAGAGALLASTAPQPLQESCLTPSFESALVPFQHDGNVLPTNAEDKNPGDSFRVKAPLPQKAHRMPWLLVGIVSGIGLVSAAFFSVGNTPEMLPASYAAKASPATSSALLDSVPPAVSPTFATTPMDTRNTQQEAGELSTLAANNFNGSSLPRQEATAGQEQVSMPSPPVSASVLEKPAPPMNIISDSSAVAVSKAVVPDRQSVLRSQVPPPAKHPFGQHEAVAVTKASPEPARPSSRKANRLAKKTDRTKTPKHQKVAKKAKAKKATPPRRVAKGARKGRKKRFLPAHVGSPHYVIVDNTSQGSRELVLSLPEVVW